MGREKELIFYNGNVDGLSTTRSPQGKDWTGRQERPTNKLQLPVNGKKQFRIRINNKSGKTKMRDGVRRDPDDKAGGGGAYG